MAHWQDSYQSPISHGCSQPLATASQDLLNGKTVDCSHHQPGQIQIVTRRSRIQIHGHVEMRLKHP